MRARAPSESWPGGALAAEADLSRFLLGGRCGEVSPCSVPAAALPTFVVGVLTVAPRRELLARRFDVALPALDPLPGAVGKAREACR